MIVQADEGARCKAGPLLSVRETAFTKTTPSPSLDETRSDVRRWILRRSKMLPKKQSAMAGADRDGDVQPSAGCAERVRTRVWNDCAGVGINLEAIRVAAVIISHGSGGIPIIADVISSCWMRSSVRRVDRIARPPFVVQHQSTHVLFIPILGR